MKVKRIIKTIFLTLSLICIDPGALIAYAEESPSTEAPEQGIEVETLPDAPTEELRFFAVNAGFKNDASSQNYDFFALEKIPDHDVDISGFRVIYTNSSGNEAGSVFFEDGQELRAQYLIIGSSKSPQYEANAADYLFNFGSSGLASTGGKLSLYRDDDLLDEICWGKLECAHVVPKFSTSEEGNYSAVLRDDEFVQEKYYPEIDEQAIERIEIEKDYCQSLRITEIYSYYEELASEQFVEIFNPSNTCSLEGLSVTYKNKLYPLSGTIAREEYLAYQNESLVLTKDPTTANAVAITGEDNEVIDEVSYPHGQKAGRSYSLVDGVWVISYARTPGSENINQEFQNCPEGKVINETTGNCVNEESETTTVCPEGKYLNPETGRCKKIEEETGLTECADGYERNPETGRCRKIQNNDGSEYAPKTSSSSSYSQPQKFVAYVALGLAVLAGLIYVILQYRREIAKFFEARFSGLRNLLGRKQRYALSD